LVPRISLFRSVCEHSRAHLCLYLCWANLFDLFSAVWLDHHDLPAAISGTHDIAFHAEKYGMLAGIRNPGVKGGLLL